MNRHWRHMAPKFGVFVDEDHCKRYTGFMNFIRDPISHVVLPILAHVPLLSCLKF